MNFELSEDQLALQGAARELLDDFASPTRVRTVFDRGGGVDHDLWRSMVAQGWTAVEVPTSDGGLGLGAVEAALLLEEVGRHVAPAPFRVSALAVDAFRFADEVERAERVAGGELASIAWSAAGDAVCAAPAGDRWVLRGRADPVLYGPSASMSIVVASVEGEPSVFVVDLDTTPRAEPLMDRTRELGWLRFEETPAERLGGADASERLLDRAATFTAAELLGASSRALDLSVEYAKDRVQFGRPIGSFQAVKHRCADMLVDVEGMRSSTYWAAWCVGADDAERSVAASTAKLWCADASKRVMASALQVHGGIGFTWEHDLHFFMKRAQLDQISFGDADFHRDRLAGLLRSKIEAGDSVL